VEAVQILHAERACHCKFGIAVPISMAQSFGSMMAHKLASVFRAWCLAILLLPVVFAAEQKSPLLGLRRDQVIQQLGEPKNQLTAGTRVIMIFARERVILRDGVVVEVEMLPPETGKRAVPDAEPAATPGAATEPAAATPQSPPATGTRSGTPAATAAKADTPAPTTTAPAAGNQTAPAETAAPAFSIKQVRPPGAPPPKAAPKQVAVAPTAAPTKSITPVTNSSASSKASETSTAPANTVVPVQPPAPAPTTPTMVARNNNIVPTVPTASSTTTPPDTPAVEPATDKTDAPAADGEPKKKAAKSRRYASEPDILEPEDAVFSPRTYLFTFAVVGIGLGFLLWQRRQRQLELAATAVSRTPFPASAPVSQGTPFPATLLSELEWKRFEELVVSYYGKTGVIATRTKAGPGAPVHIKISWKGEPRPFACVQCIAHPKGLIDVAPIQELFNVLTAEDIRRGYVVTTGKFNVPARDFAEEKHITLMSGDIFLEKINALPGSARTELVQEFSTSDKSTPTCPKCDTKMVPSAEDPAVWVCKTHPEVKIPAWK
jgi:hypothetical protein